MINKIAQTSIPLFPAGKKLEGQGPLGLEGKDPEEGGIVFNEFLTTIIGLLTVIAIVWFTITLITGAIGFIGAGGDKGAIESAKKKILLGLLGLIITISAIFILDLVGYLFDIPDILNPATVIDRISP